MFHVEHEKLTYAAKAHKSHEDSAFYFKIKHSKQGCCEGNYSSKNSSTRQLTKTMFHVEHFLRKAHV
jgi:hypothetical protein